jgi:hypothetical protein
MFCSPRKGAFFCSAVSFSSRRLEEFDFMCEARTIYETIATGGGALSVYGVASTGAASFS